MVRAARAEGLRLLSGPSGSPSIREALPGDGAAIGDLLAELGYPASRSVVEGRFRRLLDDRASWVWVATADGRLAGLAALHVLPLLERGPLGRLTAIVVCEQLRRRGIGGRLIAEVERRAREEGCERLELTTAARRAAAHAFYGHLGFAEHSRRLIKPI